MRTSWITKSYLAHPFALITHKAITFSCNKLWNKNPLAYMGNISFILVPNHETNKKKRKRKKILNQFKIQTWWFHKTISNINNEFLTATVSSCNTPHWTQPHITLTRKQHGKYLAIRCINAIILSSYKTIQWQN